MTITWKNIDQFDGTSALEASAKATEGFLKTLDKAGEIIDPTKRLEEVKKREGKNVLRNALGDIQNTEGLASLRKNEGNFDPTLLTASNGFLTKDQGEQIGDYFQKTLNHKLGEAQDSALQAGTQAADETEDLLGAKQVTYNKMIAGGATSTEAEAATALLDPSGRKAGEYAQRKDERTEAATVELESQVKTLKDVYAARSKFANLPSNKQIHLDKLTTKLSRSIQDKWDQTAHDRSEERYKDEQDALAVSDQARQMISADKDIHEIQGFIDTAPIKSNFKTQISNEISADYNNRSDLLPEQADSYTALLSNMDYEESKKRSEMTSELSMVKDAFESNTQIPLTGLATMDTLLSAGTSILKELSTPASKNSFLTQLFHIGSQSETGDAAVKKLGIVLKHIESIPNIPENVKYYILKKAVNRAYPDSQLWLASGEGLNTAKVNEYANDMINKYRENAHLLEAYKSGETQLDNRNQEYSNHKIQISTAYSNALKRQNRTKIKVDLAAIQADPKNRLPELERIDKLTLLGLAADVIKSDEDTPTPTTEAVPTPAQTIRKYSGKDWDAKHRDQLGFKHKSDKLRNKRQQERLDAAARRANN